jgi:hypothetical protein
MRVIGQVIQMFPALIDVASLDRRRLACVGFQHGAQRSPNSSSIRLWVRVLFAELISKMLIKLLRTVEMR